MKTALLIIFTAFVAGCSPRSEPQKNQIFGFHLIQKRRNARIPFELHANLIVIPARINDSDTLHFILDSGVSNTIVTDTATGKYLNTEYFRTIRLDGVGADSTVEAVVSIGNTLQVGYARIEAHNMILLKEDLLKLSELVGTPIHGLIGYELFERFVVTIDFQHRLLLIQLPKYFKYRRSYGTKVPLEIINKKPYIDDIFISELGKREKVKLLLDTGAGHAVMLNTFATNIPLPDKTIAVQLGMGLSGKISGELGRLDKVKIGEFDLSEVVTSFPDSASFGGKINPAFDRQGNIGGELLRRFRVTINYSEKYIAMKPIKRAMKEPFEHDMSGMDLRAKGANYREYYVDKVMDNSPASRAGLLEGDRLMFVNDASANTLNMTEIYKLLQRKEGRSINLIINRSGKLIFTTLVLKRVI
ncbi:aspartyl protease family protein [Persicitalea sp.]|uniref:aspartyl protease family protein n=1 Tax=Persicitalea sp. TaxID=3100273 RepID=UPI00359419D2